MKDIIKTRFEENLARVENLVKLYEEKVRPHGRGRKNALSTDVLRAAVVLLHATLEDLLRSIGFWKWPDTNDAELLNKIPFTGSDPRRRAEKINLGYLINLRGKTVDDVIKQSIEEYLDRSSFNNTKEIASFLESIGVDTKAVKANFPSLEELMKRRHLIVHQADRDDSGGRGQHRIRSIGTKTVKAWVEAVKSFGVTVLEEIE